MKKLVFLAAIAAVVSLNVVSCKQKGGNTTNHQYTINVVDTHTSQNSLDWAGVYTGTIPCADCEGIEVLITLKQDGTYEKTETYLGKKSEPFKSDGKFSWNADGQIITLEGTDAPNQYFVGENTLRQLDIEGKQIDGEHAEMYVLHKKECDLPKE